MPDQWIKRRAHTRLLRKGRTAFVAEAWVLIRSGKGKPKRNHRRPCPLCGAPMLTVRMPRGGWAHFNGTAGLGRIKHPCMYIGKDLGRRRAVDMDDLFDAVA